MEPINYSFHLGFSQPASEPSLFLYQIEQRFKIWTHILQLTVFFRLKIATVTSEKFSPLNLQANSNVSS